LLALRAQSAFCCGKGGDSVETAFGRTLIWATELPWIPLASLSSLVYDVAMKRFTYLIAFGVVSTQLICASDPPKQQEAISRLERAISRTNIFELPSFAMKADVQVDNHGKLINGSYELLWNGPDQWREEITFPGYSEVQTGGKGTVWVQRSVDFIPVAIYTVRQALGFGSTVGLPESMSLVQLALTPNDIVKKTSKRKERGEELTCFGLESEVKHSWEICVSDNSDTVVRPPFMFVDSNLQPVGNKSFPRVLSLHHEDDVVAKVNVSSLTSPAEFLSDAFTPPAGVSPEAGCMNPKLPRLVKKQAPEYPQAARSLRHQGTVSFDVLIGKDGVPQFRKLVESAGADLDDSSKHALSHWRYDPALCGGQPVEVETVLQVNYSLKY